MQIYQPSKNTSPNCYPKFQSTIHLFLSHSHFIINQGIIILTCRLELIMTMRWWEMIASDKKIFFYSSSEFEKVYEYLYVLFFVLSFKFKKNKNSDMMVILMMMKRWGYACIVYKSSRRLSCRLSPVVLILFNNTFLSAFYKWQIFCVINFFLIIWRRLW